MSENPTEVEDNIVKLLQENIEKRYNEETVRTGWDLAQLEFECCGAVNYMDYNNTAYNFPASDQTVPNTCCKLSNREAALDDPSKATPNDSAKCYSRDETEIYTKGCKDSLKEWALKHSTIIIGVGIGIAVLEIFSIVWACCFCRNIGKDD
ncbi:Hypothetical predicted protein [Mytilus galloprovincialis]|uniref:Uncharacterized protein n=1 Tax=Mytilus galloprovincialis TaxID=29158 RepID=A0A8B6BFP3_MYTGA|nr:Hypothetical predicted protein [Mytilus galloprovincialis]